MAASDHWPWATRLILDLFDSGALPNVAEVQVEPRYGVVGRLTYRDGSVRPFTGNGLEGVNNAAAARIVRDKGWTQWLLNSLGYRCPRGEKFVLDEFATALNRRLSRPRFAGYLRAADAPAWVRESITYPVFVKPARGSKGRGVYRCRDEAELRETIALYESTADRIESFVVEEAVHLPDYRVVVLDGVVRCAYQRRPLAVVGDGRSTVLELVAHLQPDERWSRNVAAAGYALDEVVPDGLRLELLEVSNLSAGGSAVDLTGRVHPHWAELCASVTRDAGLQLCGVDLACADLTEASDDYAILELNGSPGVDHYVAQGAVQQAVVRDLFREVFNRSVSAPAP